MHQLLSRERPWGMTLDAVLIERCVDLPFGYPLAWEMCKSFDELGVREESETSTSQWRAAKDCLSCRVLNRST